MGNPAAQDSKSRLANDSQSSENWYRPSLSLHVLEKAGYYIGNVGKEPSSLFKNGDCDFIHDNGNISCARHGLEVQFSLPFEAEVQSIYGEEPSGGERVDVLQSKKIQERSRWEHLDAHEALDRLDGMNELPSVEDFLCVLQKCRSRKNLKYAKRAYAHACNNQLEHHDAVGNYVVPMFVECGSVPDAQRVFDRLINRNEHSWTSLIFGYTQHGDLQHAFTLHHQMIEEKVHPSNHTYVSLLKACSQLRDLNKGQAIHATVALRGSEQDLFVGSTLISMYLECGSLMEAQEIFDKLPSRDVVTWNALMSGYAEHGLGQEAIACFEKMLSESVFPSASTLTCILKACGSVEAVDIGRSIHLGIASELLKRDVSVGNALVDMYAKCGSLAEAQKVFEKLPVRDVVSWTSLIAGYAEHGDGNEALECFDRMHYENVSPNAFTFVCTLKACCIVGDMEKGQEIHIEITQRGSEGDIHVGNTLIDMYSKHGLVLEAQKVSDKLPVRDIVSWTTLITGYTELGCGEEVLDCLEQMQCECISPDAIMFACALKACSSAGAIDKCRNVHISIVSAGFDVVSFVGNSIISTYARFGLLSEAQAIFDMLPTRDAVAWSAMINGCGMNHNGRMAIQCFEDMQQQNVKPDDVTFTCLLTACSHAGLVYQGQEYFRLEREMYGLVPTEEHFACMVDLLSRSGHLYEAEAFLTQLCSPSQEMWGSLFTSCKTYGELDLGRRCFEELVRMKPEVAAWYAIMADMYTDAGRFDDAYEIELMRKHAGAKKKPACASIEVSNEVHKFIVGENQSDEISTMLKSLNLRMKGAGHVPHIDSVVRSGTDSEKELVLCEHAERVAIAFGLLHLPQGETLRIVKNLRMCNDCHSSSKVLSRLERREIILRDDACVHHFKDGLCSCGDLF